MDRIICIQLLATDSIQQFIQQL